MVACSCFAANRPADADGEPETPRQKKNTGQQSGVFSFGGDKRDRTADLLNAIQALSQLSYTPKA